MSDDESGNKVSALAQWQVGAILCLGTTINYVNRISFNVQAPLIALSYGLSNSQLGLLAVAFRLPYALLQFLWGSFLDRIGTRLGLTLGTAVYGAASICTAFSGGLAGLAIFRSVSALGQASTWPGSSKVVSSNFHAANRGLGVALFDSGASLGGVVAPLLCVGLLRLTNTWRAAMVVSGLLAATWALTWHFFDVSRNREAATAIPESTDLPIQRAATQNVWNLLKDKTTWGLLLAFFLLDPYLSFLTDWLSVYLVKRGGTAVTSMQASAFPFLALGLGNLVGGVTSSILIKRGWNLVRARKAVFVSFAVSINVLALVNYTTNGVLIVALIAYTTLAYAACSTIILTMPLDLVAPDSVGALSGLGASAGGLGSLVASLLIGILADRVSFGPVVTIVSILPSAAAAVCLIFIHQRSPKALGAMGLEG